MKLITSGIIAMLLVTSLFAVVSGVARADTPAITIQPDTYFEPNEVETVSGTGMGANKTVQIDLVLPDANRINGVANGMTNSNGVFTVTFVSPDKSGDGYVVAVINQTQSFSTLVKFMGLKTDTLQVTVLPSQPKTNSTLRLDVVNDDLKDKNYVIVLKTTNPSNEISASYYVLHDGVCTIEKIYKEAGTYTFNVSIDGTSIGKRIVTSVIWGTPYVPPDDHNDTISGNLTWTVSKSSNQYTIELSTEAGQIISSGIIKVKKPDASEQNINIITGNAKFTAEESGDYELTYTAGGRAYLKTITYAPSVRLTVTQFSSSGSATITMTVDGKMPSEAISVAVTGDTTQYSDSVELIDGTGTFMTTTPDAYSFRVEYAGVAQTKYATYQDIYIINSLTASQSPDKASLLITGTLVGQKSGRGIANTQIKITIEYLGYSNSVRTGQDGTFRLTIALSGDKRGDLFSGTNIDITAQYGTDEPSTTQVKLTHDFIGEYGMTIGIVIIVIFGILWATGILTRLTGGKIPKPFEGGGGGGVGGIGGGKLGSSKTLLPNNISLKPPKQMGLN